jgi:hypothetical protein
MVSHSKLESLDQVAGIPYCQSVSRLVGWLGFVSLLRLFFMFDISSFPDVMLENK